MGPDPDTSTALRTLTTQQQGRRRYDTSTAPPRHRNTTRPVVYTTDRQGRPAWATALATRRRVQLRRRFDDLDPQ